MSDMDMPPAPLPSVGQQSPQQQDGYSVPPSADRPSTTLPAPLNSLVGREREVEATCALLAHPDVRELTLTGTGGVGKTRLALAIAARVRVNFADGIGFVSLAAVRDADLVLPTIAQAEGLPGNSALSPAELLQAALREKRRLLVLDNFEQVIDAAPNLVSLLTVCPHLKLLVTSREVLRVRGEREFVVQPLALPDPSALPAVETLADYGAVALFLERARDVQPTLELTALTAPPVAEICRRLDGLPLAIGLATARLKVLSLQALLERLSHRLRILTGGLRDLPARQADAASDHRLEGAVAQLWSGRHRLGGRAPLQCTMTSGQDLAAHERASALFATGTLAHEQDDHEQGDDERGATPGTEVVGVQRERGDAHHVALSLYLLGTIAWLMGDAATAHRYAEEGIARARGADETVALACLIDLAGQIALERGEDSRARRLLEEGFLLHREAGDILGSLNTRFYLERTLAAQGELAQARVCAEEHLALAKALGFQTGIAGALTFLGRLYVHSITAPAMLTLPRVAGSGTSSGAATVDGVWSVGSGSIVGWRDQQVILGQQSPLVGRTGKVWGSLTIAGGLVTQGSFAANMAALTSSTSKSTQRTVFDVTTYPTAELVLASPIALSSIPADGTVERFPAAGNLTLHGVSHIVRFTASAERAGGDIYVLADITYPYGEWNISAQGVPFLADLQSPATIEVLLYLTQGAGNPASLAT